MGCKEVKNGVSIHNKESQEPNTMLTQSRYLPTGKSNRNKNIAEIVNT